MVLDNLARGLHPYSLPSPGLAGLADSAAGTTRLLATQSANIRHEANSNFPGVGRGVDVAVEQRRAGLWALRGGTT